MTFLATSIEPSVLRWARESTGLSVEEAANLLKRDPAEIRDWEAGESVPTYAQLEALAYRVYKRPLAAFFLPAPPNEPEPKREFRTLPDVELDHLQRDTRFQLRLAHAFQLSLTELNEGVNPNPRKVFREIRLSVQKALAPQASALREYLGISLGVQVGWTSNDEALKAWREAAESSGIFVFKQAFKQKEISGFCLLESEFPIIYLNSNTTKTRQSFSLIHELAHVLLGVNGISKFDTGYIPALPPPEQRIEVFCNAFAAEVLMPLADFEAKVRDGAQPTDEFIGHLANRYRVSREVVLRRFLDRHVVTKAAYEAKVRKWNSEREASSKGGGNYYATRATYLGQKYLELVFSKLYQGSLSPVQAADHLGVRTRSIAGLEEFVLRKATPA